MAESVKGPDGFSARGQGRRAAEGEGGRPEPEPGTKAPATGQSPHRSRSRCKPNQILQILVDAAPVGICWVEDGVMRLVNRAMGRILGYKHHELEGRSIAYLFCAPQDWELALAQARQSFRAPKPPHLETRWLRRQGTPIEVSLQLKPLRRGVATQGHILTVEDITQRRFAEKKLREYRDKFRQLASELTLAEERERHRLAETVHDSLGQTLALLRIGLKKALAAQPGRHHERLLELVGLVDQAFGEARAITSELSPVIPRDMGLEWGLAWLADNTSQRHGVPTRYETQWQPHGLDRDLSVLLFRTVQELVINAVKHGQPREILISLIQVERDLEITVQDNGRGFEVVKLNLLAPPSFGLFNIGERIRALGGSFRIGSRPGVGTAAVIRVPLAVARQDRGG